MACLVPLNVFNSHFIRVTETFLLLIQKYHDSSPFSINFQFSILNFHFNQDMKMASDRNVFGNGENNILAFSKIPIRFMLHSQMSH